MVPPLIRKSLHHGSLGDACPGPRGPLTQPTPQGDLGMRLQTAARPSPPLLHPTDSSEQR